MKLKVIDGNFSVCKAEDITQVDFTSEFVFVSKTDEELSLVCLTEKVPPHTIAREDGWKMLKILGPLDFGLIGIIAGISGILAKHKISVFVVSTFDTDYLLLKKEKLAQAIQILSREGYSIV